MSTALRLGFAVVLAALMLAPAVRAHVRITTTVTWDREISAIVEARCVRCHREGGRAPMSLATYGQARPWARAIKHEVLTRRMPIWRAARGYGDFANDPSLSPFEISLIAAWVDGGAPYSGTTGTTGTTGSRVLRSSGSQVLGSTGSLAPMEPRDFSPGDSRESQLPCGSRPAPPGTLVGMRPLIERGGSLRVIARLPGGREEILGWFRDFDPDDVQTYWLRTPLEMPRGTRILTSAQGASPACQLTLITNGTVTTVPRR